MVLSKRERYAAIVTGTVLGLAGLYQLVINPLLDRRAELDAQIELAEDKLDDAQRLFQSQKRLQRQWAGMMSGGMKQSASEAESQILSSVGGWANEAGLAVGSVRPERSGEKEKDFYKMSFRATATGNMSQVGRFLWAIQTASVPVTITDMTISSRKEGTDDLSVNLGIGTIYLAPKESRP